MKKEAAVYIAPFRSRLPMECRRAEAENESASMKALRIGEWPYDFGDDPAFYGARAHKHSVTWGVCRRDVRRMAQPGHVLLFFSVEEDQQGFAFVYKFCALLTVAQKIRQTEIWNDPAFRLFQPYDNLLIRPNGHGNGWKHFESGVPEKEWHNDSWLSRLTFKDRETKEFADAQDAGKLSPEQARRFVDPNYVIFSTDRDKTFVCERPELIATCDGNGKLEKWVRSAFADELKSLTVAHTRGSLRTENEQRAHRHSTWRTSVPELGEWRGKFIDWLRRNCGEITHAVDVPSADLVSPKAHAARRIC